MTMRYHIGAYTLQLEESKTQEKVLVTFATLGMHTGEGRGMAI